MTKLERLAAACNGSVSLEANPHRDYYKSVREWFAHGMDHHRPDDEGPPHEEMAAVEAGATLWHLQWYPHTPIGFNRLFGSNLDRMLDAALKDMGAADATSAPAER